MQIILSPALSILAVLPLTNALECRPYGPIFPRPNLSTSPIFRNAAIALTETLDAALNDTIRAGWNVPNTTISVALISRDQDAPGVPLWEYHHIAEKTFLGTRVLNRDSQYQIGSISKAVTDAVLVRSGMNLDDPITKWIPSLGGGPSEIEWDSITLRGLASHLAGIPPNYGYSEFWDLKSYFEYLGFPPITPADYLMCDVFGLNAGCSRSQYVVGLKNARPVAPPMQRAVYSNVAFTLMMYAIGLSTGRRYPDLLYEYVTGPLDMKNTHPSPGPFGSSVVPPVGNSWGFWFGDATPGGGLVSTLGDLSRFVYGILTYSIFDSPAAVREWLQPRTFTGSEHSFFGMPWEIYRPPPHAIFPNYDAKTESGGHTITIQTKDGAAYGYRSRISVIDEYGIGLVLLAAGDPGAVVAINDAMLHTLVPAIEDAAREQIDELGYVGSFTSNCTSGVAFNTTIAVDGKSMYLAGLERDDHDILDALIKIFPATYGRLIPNYIHREGAPLRLYPAEISSQATIRGRTVVREDWRFVWDVERLVVSDLPGQGISSYDCLAWEAVDWIYYGSEPVDRIVFIKDAGTGDVLGVEVPFLRSLGFRDDRLTCADEQEMIPRKDEDVSTTTTSSVGRPEATRAPGPVDDDAPIEDEEPDEDVDEEENADDGRVGEDPDEGGDEDGGDGEDGEDGEDQG